MFDDIVVCELDHIDPENQEYCNPQQIAIGYAKNQGILISMLFENEDQRRLPYVNSEAPQLNFSVEVIHNDKTEYKDKYDIQTGVEITIKDKQELYKMILGSNGDHFHYFTNIPAINNTTDFGNVVFLNFPHTVEGFTFQTDTIKTF